MLRLPPVAQCLCLRDEIGEGRVGEGGGGDGGGRGSRGRRGSRKKIGCQQLLQSAEVGFS